LITDETGTVRSGRYPQTPQKTAMDRKSLRFGFFRDGGGGWARLAFPEGKPHFSARRSPCAAVASAPADLGFIRAMQEF